MQRYHASFSGRTKGAIGIFQDFDELLYANNDEDARLRLYDKYDHVNGLDLYKVSDDYVIPNCMPITHNFRCRIQSQSQISNPWSENAKKQLRLLHP